MGDEAHAVPKFVSITDQASRFLKGCSRLSVCCSVLRYNARPIGAAPNNWTAPFFLSQNPTTHTAPYSTRGRQRRSRALKSKPQQAPNVLIVLIDDMGFGISGTFGGPVHMPTAERLAAKGVRNNKFHTTAPCSPTRAALLIGRNHHMINMGSITETATASPGNTGQRPNDIAPLAETLRLNGYATAIGKNHETAAWEVSPSGPTDRWPTRSALTNSTGSWAA